MTFVCYISHNGGYMNIYPEHPGIELRKRISDKGMNLAEFARTINVSSSRISEHASCKRALTMDSAIKIADFFDTTPEYWISKQTEYELYWKYNRV